jgi:hypothetical protein
MDAQLAVDRQCQQVGGEAAAVVAHPAHEAKPGGGMALGGFVTGDDGAGRRVAPDLVPAAHAIAQQDGQCRESEQHAAVVGKEPAQRLATPRFCDDSLREHQYHREALARRQRRGKPPARGSRGGQVGRVVASARALRAGVGLGLHLPDRDRVRQPGQHLAAFDRECPAGADRVPVQLVVSVEEPELAGGAVAQGVAVFGRYRQEVVVAGVDADAVEIPSVNQGSGAPSRSTSSISNPTTTRLPRRSR